MMRFFTAAPWWVWGVLAYLIVVGLRARTTRAVSIRQLVLVPALLMSSRLYTMWGAPSHLIVSCIGGVALGCVVGAWMGANAEVRIMKAARAIELPGSNTTLVLLLGIFVAKYAFGVLQVMNPARALAYVPFEYFVSGGMLGALLGRSAAWVRRFLQA